MSDEFQRLIGRMIAEAENMKKRIGRIENGIITLGAGAVGIIVYAILKDLGFLP